MPRCCSAISPSLGKLNNRIKMAGVLCRNENACGAKSPQAFLFRHAFVFLLISGILVEEWFAFYLGVCYICFICDLW